MKIFSHRGLCLDYPENSYQALKLALAEGFSVETDIRFDEDKHIVMSHDRCPVKGKVLKFEKFLGSIKDCEGEDLVALHIKEPYNQRLLEQVLSLIISNSQERKVFIFDVGSKLLEGLKKRFPQARIGLSVSESRYTPILYSLEEIVDNELVDIIWADQWQKGLYNNNFFDIISRAGKKSYVISPELHKSLSAAECSYTWRDLISWGVSGICTDYSRELNKLCG